LQHLVHHRVQAQAGRFQPGPASTGSTTGWMTVLRTVLRSVCQRAAALLARARSSSTSAVSSVSRISRAR
jgi:hypothetical protein